MIQYTPPKSQIWGHPVRGLTAGQMVTRCTEFVDAECIVLSSQATEVMIGCNVPQHPSVSDVMTEMHAALGPPNQTNEDSTALGQFRVCRWSMPEEQLATVAACFDTLAKPIKKREVIAQVSKFWIFVWKAEPEPWRPMESAGGMFGIHIGFDRKVTTNFRFRDVDEYVRIKACLSVLGLAQLSDKYVRPKMDIDTNG